MTEGRPLLYDAVHPVTCPEESMRRVLKWLGITLGILIAVVIVAVVGLSVAGAGRLYKTREGAAGAAEEAGVRETGMVEASANRVTTAMSGARWLLSRE
jgi:hypothetical protein